MNESTDHECWLGRGVLGSEVRLPLTLAEFRRIKDARRVILEGLGLEERLGLMLENYVEYEGLLLRGALESLMYSNLSWSEFTGRTHAINRRLVNLLSSCRSYIDQLRHFASSFWGESSDESDTISAWLSEQYDSLLGFRVLEALRNHALHRGMALEHLAIQFWWVNTERSCSRTTLVPSLIPEHLREDAGFKASVLVELEAIGDKVDLRDLVKEYISGISIVHGKVRGLLKERLAQADAAFEEAIERYQAEAEESVAGLRAVHTLPNGTQDEASIFRDLIQRRRQLARKQRVHKNLWMHFVTNEPKAERRNGV